MRTSKSPAFPPRLEALRRRFKQWRRIRKIGSRIPEPLWSAAVKLAQAHGIHPTAKALGVDYYSLKKRLEEKSVSGSPMVATASGATFVELAAPAPMAVQECILELEGVEGAKMRIHFKGIEAPDLAALSRSFWGGE
jgi:hypothetical protein